MMNHLVTSETLMRLRISTPAYRILNRAVIKPENLNNFYRTYRIPRDPFFPLFLGIKREYLAEKQRKQEQREAYILKKMKSLPGGKIRFIRFLAQWEQEINRYMDYPYWMEHLYPSTKKRVHEYENFSLLEWDVFLQDYLEGLLRHYRIKNEVLGPRILACHLLELIPSLDPLAFPCQKDVLRSYRVLSLIHHPDRGGESEVFIRLKEAREVLCQKHTSES